MFDRHLTSLKLVWASLLLFSSVAAASAQNKIINREAPPTDLIREMVKQGKDAPVTIVISGRSAEYSAERLREKMMTHRERKLPETAIKTMMLDSYTDLVKKRTPPSGSVILLCALEDTDYELPDHVRDLIGVRARSLDEQDSFVEAVQISSKPLAYRVLALAADEPRLEKIAAKAFDRVEDHFSKLVLPGVKFSAHRSVLMGPAVFVENLRGWDDATANDVWNDVALLPLDGNPEQPKPNFWRKRNIVLFHDRSKNLPLPDFASGFINSANYRVNELRISRHKTEDGRSLYIYSAPTMGHLRFLAGDYSVHAKLLVDRSIDLKDLRSIGKGPMVVAATCSAQLPQNALEDARAGMELYIRNELGLTVNPRGRALQAIEKELTLQSLQGKSDTITQLIKDGVKYLWLLELETPSSGMRGTLHLLDLSKGAGEVLISLPGAGGDSDLAAASKSAGLSAVKAIHSQSLMVAEGVPALPASVQNDAGQRPPSGSATRPPARRPQPTVERTSNGRIIVVNPLPEWEVGDILSVPVPGSSAPLKIKLQSIETSYIICVPLVQKEKPLVAKIRANAPVKFEKKP